ncbi:DUF4136 domain-containing protein [Desulfuromonas sp. TF]|uniref:DUF4136 domain-containing protein n=1 Tax=Desulfuromonas sp. TF TaxID=1232410 RepID=UPI000425C1A2|nr:DUF4136 domain-containing protein [Desulfuromonas sp. TF]
MRKIRICLLLIFLIFLAACAKPDHRVESSFDWQADFEQYRSWAWLDRKPALMDTMVGDDLIDQVVRRAVTNELERTGLVQSAEKPDLMVKYQARFQEAVAATPGASGFSHAWRWRRRAEGGVQQESYRKGTLIIELIDREKNTLVWRGVTSRPIGDRQDASTKTPEAVREILSQYPPRR